MDSNVADLDTKVLDYTIECNNKQDNNNNDTSKQTININVCYKDYYIIQNNTYDYTGIRIWPGSYLLCKYIATYISHTLYNTTIIELGSGIGLVGLLCSMVNNNSNNVILSDCNNASLNLLKHNITLNNVQHNTITYNLLWGHQNTVNMLNDIQQQLHDKQYNTLILGSDIIYPNTKQDVIQQFFDTVDTIIQYNNSKNNNALYNNKFILSYYNRSYQITKMLFDIAIRYNYICDILLTDNQLYNSNDIGYVLQFTKISNNNNNNEQLEWYNTEPFISMCSNSSMIQQQSELYDNVDNDNLLNIQYDND